MSSSAKRELEHYREEQPEYLLDYLNANPGTSFDGVILILVEHVDKVMRKVNIEKMKRQAKEEDGT